MVDYGANLRHVLEGITLAALDAGRRPEEITLIAVSKTHSAEAVQEACRTGLIAHLGENRVQEGMVKIPAVQTDATWHLIGRLQRNKARRAMELFDWIQSVDSPVLAQKLSDLAHELGVRKQVLLEVNTSGEPSKSGLPPCDLDRTAEILASDGRLGFCGLMTVGPLTDDASSRRRAFELLRECAEKLRAQTGLPLPVLSMGMSGDYREAIAEGSTMVRIGTAIFGQREYGGVNA